MIGFAVRERVNGKCPTDEWHLVESKAFESNGAWSGLTRRWNVRRNDARWRWAATTTLVAVFIASCGGQTNVATTPTPTPVGEQTAAAGGTKPTVEVQPVPDGLFIVGRVRQSDQLVSRIGSWCNLPFGINDGLSVIAEELPTLLDLEQPVDFAISLAPELDPNASEQVYVEEEPDWQDGGLVEPEPRREPSPVYMIATVAVTKPAELVAALKEAGKDVAVADSGDVTIELEHDLHCVLTASAGPTAHRLACGPYPDDLDALARYANTALVTEKMPEKAAYMELRVAPLRQRHGNDVRQMRAELPDFLKEVAIGNERFDRAMAEAVPAVVEEIIAWVDGVERWDFSLDFMTGRDGLVGESTLTFRKADSYVADLLRRGAADASPAPRLFWDLPRDVDAASFNGKIAATSTDKRIANNISEFLAGALEYGGVASGTLDNWVTSLRALMESRGTVVVGAGSLPLVKATEPPAKVSVAKKGKAAVESVFDALGYYLIGVEGDQGAYARIWRSSVATFNDKRLRSELAKTLEEEMPKLPLIRSRRLPASKTLPSIELFDLSYKVPKAASDNIYKLDKVGVYVAMATVGERTWFGFGFTEAAALDPVKQMIAGVDYPKLETREGLTGLHERRVLYGSFSSLNSYAKLLAGLPFGPGQTPFGESLLRAMPHRGRTPSVFEVWTSAAGPTLTARVEFPREVFEDGSAFTMAMVAAFTSAFSGANGFGLNLD